MVADKSTNTSSYTIQALTLTHHLQTVTFCTILNAFRRSAWPFLAAALRLYLHVYMKMFAPTLLLLTSALYLVSFDSNTWLSPGPTRPLQTSFSLKRQTEIINFFVMTQEI